MNAWARSVLFFILAGLLEIGGGYLMWLWLRERRAWWVGVPGFNFSAPTGGASAASRL